MLVFGQIDGLEPELLIFKVLDNYLDVARFCLSFFSYRHEHQALTDNGILKDEKVIRRDTYVTDVTDGACACLKSVLRLVVDKDHRTSNWVLILHQTCTTIEMN